MLVQHGYRFETERLLVDEWGSFSNKEWELQNSAKTVQQILTPIVTISLPLAWQGSYTYERAQEWVTERNSEGPTLLAIDKSHNQSVGIIVLFEIEGNGHLRLGYILKESSWGKGYATELVKGFVYWCKNNNIKTITGGVEPDNIASSRVLEKCGFIEQPTTDESSERMFILKFRQC